MEKIVYLDIEFWDRFNESFPKYLTYTDSSITNMENYIGMYRFILSAHLRLNISEKDTLKKIETDDKLKILWKKSNDGYCKMEFNAIIPHDINLKTSEDLNAVYLIGDDNSTNFDKLGIMSITPSNIGDISYLFKDSGSIIKSERGNWDILYNYKQTFNAILIVDPYLLSASNELDNNIFEILNILLPKEITTTMHLSIISKDFKFDPKPRYEKVKKYIKSIRPNYDILFTLYNDRDKIFHDRVIITNNIMITSGAGFAIYNKDNKAKNSTSVSIVYPHFNNTISQALSSYNDIIERAIVIYKKTLDYRWLPGKTDPKSSECWGDGTRNRLLTIK